MSVPLSSLPEAAADPKYRKAAEIVARSLMTPEGQALNPELAETLKPHLQAMQSGRSLLSVITGPLDVALKLAQTQAHVAWGKPAPEVEVSSDNDVMLRRLRPVLRGESPVVILTGLPKEKPFESSVLVNALDHALLKARVPGTHNMETLDTRRTWILVAEKPVLAPELERRSLLVRLNHPDGSSFVPKDGNLFINTNEVSA
jgi:hypothetical protein